MRALVLIVVLVVLGCSNTNEPCSSRPTDPLCQIDSGGVDMGMGDSGRDAGMPDTGADAGPMPDMGMDGGFDAHVLCDGVCAPAFCLVSGAAETCEDCLMSSQCTGTTAVCDPADHTCVGCTMESDCTASGMHCDVPNRTCVACTDTTQCMTTAAARCDTGTHACAACTASSDCSHLSGTAVCNAGTCVQCTVGEESACGANSCNPATHTCTTTPRTSVGTCHACVADSECSSGMDRCVPMQFMGAAHGSYCLRQLSAGCTRPYAVPSASRASVSGEAAAVYCGVDETATTCEGVQSLRDDVSCSMPSDCGATGLMDGLCQTVNGVANKCTYACGTAADCPSGRNCGGAGYCGAP